MLSMMGVEMDPQAMRELFDSFDTKTSNDKIEYDEFIEKIFRAEDDEGGPGRGRGRPGNRPQTDDRAEGLRPSTPAAASARANASAEPPTPTGAAASALELGRTFERICAKIYSKRAQATAAFRFVDANMDNAISRSELRLALQRMGADVSTKGVCMFPFC